jgi:hypothetical protein
VWGWFGDYIGGSLNPLFALSALIALLYTIYLQKTEIHKTNIQLKRSAKALEIQHRLLKLQQFESTYFQLLGLYSDVLNGLSMLSRAPIKVNSNQSRHPPIENRNCIRMLYSILMRDYLDGVERGDYIEPYIDIVNNQYHRFYMEYGHLVGHYFRTIFNIIKFVERADLDFEEQKVYTNLLRAQFSKYELGFLLYNSISTYGRESMLPLVNKYSLLKHLEDDVLGEFASQVHHLK